MATFTPFMQGSEAQSIISNYLGGGYASSPNVNTAGQFRNPLYDLRTVQEGLGELDPSADFPNPQLDFSAENAPVDPCPEGFMLVDGVCQPIVEFGQSAYDEQRDDNNNVEERPYYSIDAMKNLSDEEFLDYMTSGVLGNSLLGYLPSKGTQVTMKPNLMPPLFKLAFGGQDKLRKDFMMSELMKRGYFTGNFDKNQNPIFDIANKNVNTNVGGIESMLPQNVLGQPVTDVFGDTYQQVVNQDGNTGYTFTSGTPLPAVSQQTQGGVNYGTGRGGTSNNQGTVVVNDNVISSPPAVSYTNNEGQGTHQAGGGVPNPHTDTGFSGGNKYFRFF
ncbi:MAG: hypothetical protein H8E12_00240 [Rhodobacteraceae bacterium]|nr:hypothetical protein [Paracoccaceae bacterium]